MKGLLIAVAFLGFIGCTTHVKLTVRNPTPLDQQVRIDSIDESAVRQSSLQLGKATANGGQVSGELDVKRGYQIQIVGLVPGDVQASVSPPRTVTAKPDPLLFSYDLTLPQYLTDDAAEGQIQAAFEKLGPKMPGFVPLPIEDALGSWFGSLIVIPSDEERESEHVDTVLFQLKPGQFSPPTTVSEFHYPVALSERTIRITHAGSAKAAATFPAFGLAVEGELADVLEVNWTLTDYGMVQKSDPADWNYIDAINRLDPSKKTALFNVLTTNPGARIIYVDKLYVFRNAIFNVREGRKLSAGAELNALSIVTANGAYSFESSTTRTKNRGASVLNVAGTEVALAIVKQDKGPTPTISPIVEPHLRRDERGSGLGFGSSSPMLRPPPQWTTVRLLPTFERKDVMLNLPGGRAL